ncbi:uncharacterized protein LOC130675599 [Microplitis mediator]|uniref:uncharacterized protein LOC130675599 n=1 Tax=Microplitis mediator TaxID=375433 RepID=UPI0025578FCF|nr:uncharacterized protein LOC130675599 [Microplitis mediator]
MKLQMYKCCLWSLKTGVLIFGIFEIFRFIFIVAVVGVDLNNLGLNYTEDGEDVYEPRILDDPELVYFFVPLCFIMLLFAVFMIWGSQKDNYKFIMPHFYAHLFFIVSLTITQVYDIILEFAYYNNFGNGLFAIAKGFLGDAADIYFCVMTYSRIKEIKSAKNIIYPLIY